VSSRERTTFIADPDGRVAQALRKVKPAERDELVVRALGKESRPPA
jgi:peroxiredoxin